MRYRRLGKTNLRVSVIGIGTWQFGGEWGKDFTQDEVNEMFSAAREGGINLVDTAECYGDHTSEAFIGNAVRADRANWIIATKFGHRYNGHSKRIDLRSAADIGPQVEGSLKALKTEYIDLLQYHSIRDSEFEDDAVTALLEQLVKSGKVRHIGNSVGKTDGAWHQVEACTRRKCETLQVIYNRLDRLPEEKILPSCIEQNLGVLARVPLASGYLSGKYRPGVKFVATDIRSERDPKMVDERLRLVQQIQQSEVPTGVPIGRWALAWCLQHPAVSCVIPGCKDVTQVRDNAKAASLPLIRDDHPQAWK